MKRIAIIDMGTNTFHLLIGALVESKFSILHREKVPVKIGVGGINQGIITPDAISRAVTTLKSFKSTITELEITEVLAIGTSALRNAQNKDDVIKRIQTETGIRAQLISGLEEARYIYQGARAAIPLGEEKCLIMDIGGGSVEFIIGNQVEIFWSQSFEIGGQRLLERFQKHDPILKTEIDQLFAYIDEELNPLWQALQDHKPLTLIGSSGTFDTLSDIYCFRNDIPVQETPETPFSIQAFDEIFEELLVKDRSARMQIPGMIEMRVDMIVVACCLIKFLLMKHTFKHVRVSSYSLKEGVLASMLA